MKIQINKQKFLLLHYKDNVYSKRSFCKKTHISLKTYDKILNELCFPIMSAIQIAKAFDIDYKDIIN